MGLSAIKPSPWNRTIPSGLIERYREWLAQSSGLRESEGVGLPEMLSSLVEGGSLHCGSKDGGCQAKLMYSRKTMKNTVLF